MSDSDEPIWERTLRRIRNIWPLGESFVLKERVAPSLPEDDLPRLREIIDACLEGRGGEVSARARAAELGETYSVLNTSGRRRFLQLLAMEYDVDNGEVEDAIARWRAADEPEDLQRATTLLRNLLDPPRSKLLRQFNALEEGVKFLVDLRAELIEWAREDPRLKVLDQDVYRLLTSWFDVGFLDLQQITWKTPAAVLEKLIEYEAVHAISSWQDMKNRLEKDRRCYAFFHPRMPEEPLIFVEVALVNGLSTNIHDLLDLQAPSGDPEKADTAIFYSISNCQKGLAGVSFGNFLIKRVVADLAGKLANLKKFSTLSPIPGFVTWLRRQGDAGELSKNEASLVASLFNGGPGPEIIRRIFRSQASMAERTAQEALQPMLLRLCARYLVQAKREEQAHDRVAHFHLTNGARIHRLNWAADLSDKGLMQSAGLMVNYLYDLPHIEKNHEAYRSNGEIAVSSTVRKLMK